MVAIPRIGCARARSLLFVPGNRPERFDKAARSGADAIILDLEDSVPAEEKAAARDNLASRWHALQQTGVPLVVRVNPADGDAGRLDLEQVRKLPGLAAVMLPKSESADTLARVHAELAGTALLPLIESAGGLDALPAIAAAPGVLRLVVGHIDFMLDTGITADEHETELAPLRFAVAMATRRAGLAAAIDGVTVQIGDAQRLRLDTLRTRRYGLGGKLCIHPSQVAAVNEGLAPSAEELDWARRVVAADAAAGGAAVQLEGRMIDLPVVLRARATLERAMALGAAK